MSRSRRNVTNPTPDAGASPRRPRVRRVVWPLVGPVVVVLAGGLAYLTSFDGVFVLDDVGHIAENTRIRTLDASLLAARRPLVAVTLALNYAAAGLDVAGYHAVNLAIHLGAGLLLYGIVRRTLAALPEPNSFAGAARGIAVATAVLWTVHPLQTQSVTYLIQRGECLMGMFYLLTLYAFIRGAAAPGRSPPWYATSVIACALGMASKEVMVTAPVMVLLYDTVFLEGSILRALRRRWPVYAGLAATWGVLVLGGILRIFDTSKAGSSMGFGYRGATSLEYLRTQPEVILHYLRLGAWPDALCLDYGWPIAAAGVGVVVTALLVGGLAVLTAWGFWRRRRLAFLGLWFFVILAPTSSIVPIRDVAFEHRMYLSLAAVVAAVVLGGATLLGGTGRRLAWSGRKHDVIAIALVVVVAAGLGTRTAVRNRDYRSVEAMWRSVVEVRPEHARGHQNLASALFVDGRVDESLTHYTRAAELEPGNVMAQIGLGNVFLSRREFGPAVIHFTRAVELNPRSAPARNNLGSLYAMQGRLDLARDQFAAAVESKPRHIEARLNLGRLLAMQGETAAAIEQYRAILAIDPGNAKARDALGRLTP